MKLLRQCSTIFALTLLASVCFAAGDGGSDNPPGANQRAPDSQRAPKDSCLQPCKVMRISTRCECSLGKTLPTSISA